MLKSILAVVAVLSVIPASAQVHQATPLEVLLAKLGVNRAQHDHDMAGMTPPEMSGMKWDGAAVTVHANAATALATTDAIAAPNAVKTFTIVARQFEFDITPSPFVVNAGDDVTLNISVPANDGSTVGHGFFLENYMTDQLGLARGKSVSIRFTANTPGTFTYLCTISSCGSGHTAMNGTFTVQAQPAGPSIASISPTTGPATGGTLITISGSGFANGATVKIGGLPATGVNVVSASTITALTPLTAPSEQLGLPRDVVVTNPDGTSATLAGAFSYTLPPLSLASIDPAGATPEGNITATITGTGFNGAVNMIVTFGGVAATNVSVLSTTVMRVTVPPHASGVVDVKVTLGSNTVTLANGFTYNVPPPRKRAVKH